MSKPIIWSYWNHEPIYHLKRMANDGGSVFSLGEWVDQWYDRLHTRELIQKAADLGINVIYTHFYKGSGLLFEHDEMLRTKEIVDIAHEFGIKVLGYVSLGSFYTENIYSELPDYEKMLAIGHEGEFLPTLEHQYYRLTPCFNSEEFLVYIKKVLKYGVEEIGLDGFHFDQSSRHFCYCEKCQEKFKLFLKENIENPYDLMGIKDFDNVSIPNYNTVYKLENLDLATGKAFLPKGNIHDPLLMWYLKFVRQTVKNFHENCFGYVKEVSGGKAYVLHNPGFSKIGKFDFKVKGFAPQNSPESADFAFVENLGGYFSKEDGRLEGQIESFKFAERYGYKVFDTSWLLGETIPYRFPKSIEEVEKFSYHSAVFGGIVGSPWTVRSMKNNAEVAIDTPYLYEGLSKSFNYYNENIDIFSGKEENRVKLLYSNDNWYASENGKKDFSEVLAHLVEDKISFSIIDESDITSLRNGDFLILPNVLYADNSVFHSIKSAFKKGVKIIVTGSFGHYNADTKGRSLSDDCYNLNGISEKYFTVPEKVTEIIDSKVSMNLNDVVVETRVLEDGRFVLHLLNADNTHGTKMLKATFKDEILKNFNSASVVAPDNISCNLKFENNVLSLEISDFKTLATVIFE